MQRILGGRGDVGAVYKLSPPTVPGGAWTEKILYSFRSYVSGANPIGNLLLVQTNNSKIIYGVTQGGIGTDLQVVYKLTPPAESGGTGTETVIHEFTGGTDGSSPFSGVISDHYGNLYGTTCQGGQNGMGVVYELSPPLQPGQAWTYAVLYSFEGGSDSACPNGSLIFDRAGALYGTTYGAGSEYPFGTVFKLSPPATQGGAWTESILYTFNGSSDGNSPRAGVVFDRAGALYGTTCYGGIGGVGAGTVFKLAPPATEDGAWTFSVLYTFLLSSDGGRPFAGLTLSSKGAIYGTTFNGGNFSGFGCGGYGCGTAFKLIPPTVPGGAWTEKVLHAFSGSDDGANPWSPLLHFGNAFYGTTFSGSNIVEGTVFELAP